MAPGYRQTFLEFIESVKIFTIADGTFFNRDIRRKSAYAAVGFILHSLPQKKGLPICNPWWLFRFENYVLG